MYANGTFKNPFTDFDFTKIAGEFKLPTVNVETIVETARKNFAVMTTANTAAVETMKTIAQRQGDMVRAAMEDFSKHGSEVLAAATVEEKAIKQIDFVKKSYETAIANSRELAGLYTKSQTEAFEALTQRVAELTDEVKAAIAKK
jgi:phasin family protein